MASAATTSRQSALHLSVPLPPLRPSWSEENVSLNLGIDEDESPSPFSGARTPVTPLPQVMDGRDAWARFSLRDDDDAESVVGEGDFDCHICLRTATNPCVTRCGHLFCNDDLEQWLRIHPRCPVCSSFISLQHDVVKIFGRGRERRRRSSASDASTAPETRKSKPPTAPSSAASLPSPPATPSPVRPPALLPDPATNLFSASSVRRRAEPKDRPFSQPPHPLLIDHLLRHQFARLLSLVALVFFLLLIGRLQ
ncbi:hypothetical protein DACRYDRAFT_115543 [Dacryopinax primogenitus]|uniref:RING-type E3 ubiquitin transferase n=1 Tax=Dacryopinax primogenitus (strain DJM 731) TaxID=1858805 RepID=M5G3W6_DACPD|nr:uncharacterized protein DACRYDRAFT_115543 [Dacryopinax primogenitus]EJU03369.1 hypothetical protein DACRYDRAFT_115543 [Dacryopinax primogenitus]